MILRTTTKIAIARAMNRFVLFCRSAVGLGPLVRVKRHGVVWDLDLQQGIDLSIYVLGSFEPRTGRASSRLARPRSTGLDIGANIGAHTLPLARYVGPQGHIIAFEPTDYAYSKLRSNVDLNPSLATRIVVEQIMLTSDAQARPETSLYSSWPLDADTNLHPKHHGRLMSTEHAHAETLDDYLKRTAVRRVDLIKIDVDGHELPVFKGSLATLREFHPAIVMEVAPYSHDEEHHSFEEFIDIFRGLHYSFKSADTGRPVPVDAAQLRRDIPVGSGMNVIAERVSEL